MDFRELEGLLQPLGDSDLSMGSSILSFSRLLYATKHARAFESLGQIHF